MSLNPTNLYIQAAPLPATFKGNPNDLFVAMIERMRILSPSGVNFVFVGDVAPTSNVGPWLKNGSKWYVWDAATKQYIPQDISDSFTPPYFIGNAVPSATTPNLWLQTTQNPTSTNPTAYGTAIRWFMWDGARWSWPNPVPSSSGARQIWADTEPNLWYYDGGDGTDPANASDYVGGMWMKDTTITPPAGATFVIKRSARQFYTP